MILIMRFINVSRILSTDWGFTEVAENWNNSKSQSNNDVKTNKNCCPFSSWYLNSYMNHLSLTFTINPRTSPWYLCPCLRANWSGVQTLDGPWSMDWSILSMQAYFTYSQFVLFFVIIDKHISTKHNYKETDENW